MCKSTKQKYSGCYCITLLQEICAPHIEHTRIQIDNEPCPGLISCTTEAMTSRCANKMDCVEKQDVFYAFENNGARMFEKDRKKRIEAKERKERENRERKAKEERDRKMAEREESDWLYWEEKRKKKPKKEKVKQRGEVNMNDLPPWTGKVEGELPEEENTNVRGISWQG